MNDFSIFDVKSRLESVLAFFEPEKPIYHTLNNCINNIFSAEGMYNALLKIGNTDEYSNEFQNFFNSRFEELKLLAEKDREIKECLGKIESLNTTLKLEFNKRNIEYVTNFVFNYNYLNMTYNEKKDYLYYCNKEINNLSDKLSALSTEKVSGESFDEKMGNKYDDESQFIENGKDEINRIQKQAENNIREFVNPSLNSVLNFINDYKDKQEEDSFLNLKVVYDNNSGVILDIGFKGTEVNEKFPLLKCYYSDASSFNKEIYPVLLQEHIIEGGLNQYETSDDSLKSENVHNETFEVHGNSSAAYLANSYFADQVVSKEGDTLKKKKDYVRVRKIDNSAFVNGIIFSSLLVLVVIIMIVSILMVV